MRLDIPKGKSLVQGLLPWLLILFAFLAVAFPIVNTDIWWHLASGREILRTHAIPDTDIFSVSSLGKAWIDVHWFFQLVAFFLWRLGASTALVMGKCLLFSLALLILLKAAYSHSQFDSALPADSSRVFGPAVLALLVLAGADYVLMRPVVFSLFFMSLFLFFIGRYLNSQKWRNLVALVIVEVFWANTQPLFPLGAVIVGCFFVGEGLAVLAHHMGISGFSHPMNKSALMPLGLSVLLVAAASMLTPFGLDGLLIPFKLFFRIGPQMADLFGRNVSENISPWLMGRINPHALLVFSLVLGLSLLSFLADLRRVSLSRFFLLGAMLVLALMANRNLLLFYWVAGPIVIANLAAAAENQQGFAYLRFFYKVLKNPALALAVFLVLSVPMFFSITARASISRPAPFRVPDRAIETIAALDEGGNVFNSVRYGGFLIWKLYPRLRPFIDGRIVLRSAAQFARYLDVLDHPEKFWSYSDEHDFQIAVLPVNQPNRYQKLIAALYKNTAWELVFTDGTQSVFTRNRQGLAKVDLADKNTVAKIVASISKRFEDDAAAKDQAIVNLGLLLNLAKEHARAIEILRPQKSKHGRALLARSLYLEGNPPAAKYICQDILREDQDDVDSLLLSAQIALDAGELKQALDFAKRALEEDPYNGAARQILLNIQSRAG